jgi:hypothetical protein
MTYTAVSVIVMDTCVVEDTIVCRWRLKCCRMAVTIYQRLMKLFPPTWQRHRQMIASTIVSITKCFQQMVLIGVNRDGKAHPRLDASLLQ